MTNTFVPVFSNLERDFDLSTVDNCWSCTKPRQELSFLDEQGVGMTLQVSGVKNYIHKSGKRHNRFCPDFVLLDDDELEYVRSKIKLAMEFGEWQNPFRVFSPKSRFAIELFGDYWHSEDVTGVDPVVHVKQVTNAYESIGWDVEIVWEKDVLCGNLSPRVEKLMCSGAGTISDGLPASWCRYINDPILYRSENGEKRDEVVSGVFGALRKMGRPYIPSRFEAVRDVRKLLERTSRGIKSRGVTSAVGQTACRHFMRSLFDARPRCGRSINDLWDDDDALSLSIRRQLELFDGKQTIGKIKNELLHSQGYRSPSNFQPMKAVMIYSEAGLHSGMKILDPCCGYGGRLLASWVMGVDYFGVDANSTLIGELQRFSQFLNDLDKRCEIALMHGAIEDSETRVWVESQGPFDFAFTSPPYYRIERYSEDEEQSDLRYVEWDDFVDGFLDPLLGVVWNNLTQRGKLCLNIPKNIGDINFYSTVKERAVDVGFGIDHVTNLELVSRKLPRVEVLLCLTKDGSVVDLTEVPGFGVKNAPKNYYLPHLRDGIDYVRCEICNERFARIGRHASAKHNMSIRDYKKMFPESHVQSESDSKRVSSENQKKSHGKYRKHIVYQKPDGSFVFRANTWRRAWGGSPPEHTRMSADSVDYRRNEGQDGIDYVSCEICGYTASNLTRHIRREHGDKALQHHKGPIKSKKCLDNLSKASFRTWDKRGRKPKSEKRNDYGGLTKESLHEMLSRGMSYAAVGREVGRTGEGVSYLAKKWGLV